MKPFHFKDYIKNVDEAIDLPDGGEYFDPSAKSRIEGEIYEIEDILPNMSDKGKRYFEMMIEGTYEELVKRIDKYVGIKNPANRLAVMHALVSSLHTINSIEQSHVKHLENIALQTVLNLEEFDFIKKVVAEGNLKFNVKIFQPNLRRAFAEWEENVQEDSDKASETELSPGENAELDAINILMSADRYKAAFANFITQGEAINSWEMFKLVKHDLDQIDVRLIKLYEMFAVCVHAGYFMTPFIDMNGALDTSAGMAQVSPEAGSETYTITAHGINFVALIHEIVKGVYDYIGLHSKDQNTLDQEDINDEKLQLMAGPSLAKKFKQAILNIIGNDNMKFILPLYAKIYGPEVTAEEIKGILSNNPNSRMLIKNLLKDVQDEQGEFETPPAQGSSFKDEGDTYEGDEWKRD